MLFCIYKKHTKIQKKVDILFDLSTFERIYTLRLFLYLLIKLIQRL